MVRKTLILLMLPVLLWGCAATPPAQRLPESEEALMGCTFFDQGLASWYGNELRGNKTANGERFDPDGITAAHRTLPFGTKLRVVLDRPGADPQGVLVRVNDRGPFVKGRIIDLSWGAAKSIGMLDTRPVRIYRCN